MIFVSYLIIIICNRVIWWILKKAQNDGQFNAKLQRQITIVLLVESFFPLVTVALPILFDLFTVQYGWSIPWLTPFRKTIVCFGPLINPIVKLTIISDFRNKIYRKVTTRLDVDPTRTFWIVKKLQKKTWKKLRNTNKPAKNFE
uniref:G-protein coupled receptors family 1 profile domain-containing protein n=1 Tax=Panagrolaimus sp. JU765 TaxID=591449 RepID=A0AC34RRI1_9BILA